jgi:hypothetical protein
MATDIKHMQTKFKHFGNLRAELENKKSPVDSVQNLYDHMSKVMDHIILHCPNEALNKLEEISYLIKNDDKYAIQNFLELHKKHLYATPGEPTIKTATDQYIN